MGGGAWLIPLTVYTVEDKTGMITTCSQSVASKLDVSKATFVETCEVVVVVAGVASGIEQDVDIVILHVRTKTQSPWNES